MKWSFVCLLLTALLAGCANNNGGSMHSQSQASHDYVKPGAIQIPGYSMDSEK